MQQNFSEQIKICSIVKNSTTEPTNLTGDNSNSKAHTTTLDTDQCLKQNKQTKKSLPHTDLISQLIKDVVSQAR